MKIFFTVCISILGIASVANAMHDKKWVAPKQVYLLNQSRLVRDQKKAMLILPDGRRYLARTMHRAIDMAAVSDPRSVHNAVEIERALARHIGRYGGINEPAPFFTLASANEYPEGGLRPLMATPLQAAAVLGNLNIIHGLLVEGADSQATTSDVPETPLELLLIAANAQNQESSSSLGADVRAAWDETLESARLLREQRREPPVMPEVQQRRREERVRRRAIVQQREQINPVLLAILLGLIMHLISHHTTTSSFG